MGVEENIRDHEERVGPDRSNVRSFIFSFIFQEIAP